MRLSTSMMALMLGIGIYGVGPIVTKLEPFNAAPAHASEDDSGHDGSDGGDGGDGGEGGNNDHGGDSDHGGDNGDDGDDGDDNGDNGDVGVAEGDDDHSTDTISANTGRRATTNCNGLCQMQQRAANK